MKGRSTRLVALASVALGMAVAVPSTSANPGQPDRSFGGGIVAVQPPPVGNNGIWNAQSAAAGPNGRVYVLEQSASCPQVYPFDNPCVLNTLVSRYLNNGRRDLSYGGGDGFAQVLQGGNVYAAASIAVDREGGVVIAQAGVDSLELARLDPEGRPVAGFGSAGVASYPCGCFLRELHVFADKRGLITVAGRLGSGPGYAEGSYFARFSSNGAPSASFGGGDGVLVVPQLELGAVMVRANGAIVASEGRCCPRGQYLVKISPQGSLNLDFAPVLRVRRLNGFTALAPLPSGDIAVAGIRGSLGFVARLRPGGTLRRAFGRKGVTRLANRQISMMAVDRHGRIAIAGPNFGASFLGRLSPAGRVEKRFRNGLRGISISESGSELAYAGPRPLLFDPGYGEAGCRAYCPPKPLLYRFLGGPGKPKHRSHRR